MDNVEYDYAVQLATYLWKEHYKADSPNWKPLDTLIGVLTQIDNMIADLVRVDKIYNRNGANN